MFGVLDSWWQREGRMLRSKQQALAAAAPQDMASQSEMLAGLEGLLSRYRVCAAAAHVVALCGALGPEQAARLYAGCAPFLPECSAMLSALARPRPG
jgi:hypothetical protein